MRTVNFYHLPKGNRPVEEFLDSLTGKQAQKVLWVLQLIEELDVVPRQYFKKLVGRERCLGGSQINWKLYFQMVGLFRRRHFVNPNKWLCQENTKDSFAGNCARCPP